MRIVRVRRGRPGREIVGTEVRDRLEGVDLSAIVANRRQHAYHLLGLALHHTADPERAAAVLAEGLRSTEGLCALQELLDLAEPLAADAPSEDASAPRSPVRELRDAVRDADACLLRGDLSGARAAIDRPLVWSGDEVQSLARLAELHLQGEPEDDAGRFRQALALARFLKAQREQGSLRRGFAPARRDVAGGAPRRSRRAGAGMARDPNSTSAVQEHDSSNFNRLRSKVGTTVVPNHRPNPSKSLVSTPRTAEVGLALVCRGAPPPEDAGEPFGEEVEAGGALDGEPG